MSELNYMYIVRCSDDTLYTGWTNHLEERIEAHNRGKGARYTRSRRPVELVYFESFATKEEAEGYIKHRGATVNALIPGYKFYQE